MPKKKVKQSTTMEVKKDFFDRIDYEISPVLLELSNPVVFSSSLNSSPSFLKWGRTKKRSSFVSLNPLLIKSLPITEVAEIGSTSSSSCLTGEAKKTNNIPITSPQPNTSCSVFEIQLEETGLLSGQVGLRSQPIRDDENLRQVQPLICVDDRTAKVKDVETTPLQVRGFDLNLPAAEEGNDSVAAMEGFQRLTSKKVQAAAEARQRRLGLIRSKKLYQRFISLH